MSVTSCLSRIIANDSLVTRLHHVGSSSLGRGSDRAPLRLALASARQGEKNGPPLGGRRRLHSGQDTNHFCSLSGWDVLGHVHNRIHGNLWIGLNKAGENKKKKKEMETKEHAPVRWVNEGKERSKRAI